MIVNTTNRVAIVHMLLFQHCLYKWSCLFLQDGDEELWPSLQTGAYLAPDKPMALTWCLGYQCRRPGYAPVQETHRTMGRVCAFCFCISWMYTLRLCTSLWDTCSFTPLLLSYWIQSSCSCSANDPGSNGSQDLVLARVCSSQITLQYPHASTASALMYW